MWNAANPYPPIVFKETQGAGRTLGIEVQSLELPGPDDFEGAFEAARKRRPDAMITVEDPLTFTYRKRIADFHDRAAIAVASWRFVAAGGLISYGQISLTCLGVQRATLRRFSKAQSLPTFPCSSRPNSISSLT
jgi:hypothetical protein